MGWGDNGKIILEILRKVFSLTSIEGGGRERYWGNHIEDDGKDILMFYQYIQYIDAFPNISNTLSPISFSTPTLNGVGGDTREIILKILGEILGKSH
jgi:hypothetical protein